MFEKKGQIGEITHDLVAFLVAFFFVIIFFLVSIAYSGCSNEKIIQKSEILQDKIRMQNYLNDLLNKKIKVESKEITFSELLLLAQTNKTYKEMLEKEIKETEKFYEKTSKSCYKFRIGGYCIGSILIIEKCRIIESIVETPIEKIATEEIACVTVPSNKTISLAVYNLHGKPKVGW